MKIKTNEIRSRFARMYITFLVYFLKITGFIFIIGAIIILILPILHKGFPLSWDDFKKYCEALIATFFCGLIGIFLAKINAKKCINRSLNLSDLKEQVTDDIKVWAGKTDKEN